MFKAADLLAERGIAAQVVNIHTIKPIDTEFIQSIASSHGKIVTVEDHASPAASAAPWPKSSPSSATAGSGAWA